MAQRAHEPLTSERLAEIRRWVNDPDYYFDSCDDDSEWLTIRDLLAEADRLHAALAAAEAREAALREVVRAVAGDGVGNGLDPYDMGWPRCNFGGDCGPVRPDHAGEWRHADTCIVTQARALLAATEAGEGEGESDG